MDGRRDRASESPPGGESAEARGRSILSARPVAGWKLAAIGVGLGLGVAAFVLRHAPHEKVTQASVASTGLSGSVLVEDEGPLGEVLLQFTAGEEDLVAATYEDFLRALDPKTRLVAVVPKDPDSGVSDANAWNAFVSRVDPTGAIAGRTRVVDTPGPITVWSKDRALVLAAPRIQLAVPMRPDPAWRQRFNDWATLTHVARAWPEEFVVNELPLDYDAGDFAVTGDKIVVDVNLLTKNQKHGLTTRKMLSEHLARTFHRDIVMLGDVDGDVPRHHLSMYMTPLGKGTVLVGDPRAGRDLAGKGFTPGEESPDSGEPLVADFSDPTVARFDRAAKDLVAAGFTVERVPVVPFDDKTYLTYTNGVYETRDGRKIAYLPQYAKDASDSRVAAMDKVAAETYRRLGWEVRPIRVRNTYRFHGTIGCLCNVLRRGGTP